MTATEPNLTETQQLRRALETEMAGIDSRIRGAIMNADVKLMTELQARKAELPMLCLIQSHAERRLADQVYGKDYNDARLALDSAKADFEAKTEALEALKERHRNELEAAEFALRESETTRNSAQSAFILANNVLTRAQQGHKHALERLGDAMTNGGSKK